MNPPVYTSLPIFQNFPQPTAPSNPTNPPRSSKPSHPTHSSPQDQPSYQLNLPASPPQPQFSHPNTQTQPSTQTQNSVRPKSGTKGTNSYDDKPLSAFDKNFPPLRSNSGHKMDSYAFKATSRSSSNADLPQAPPTPPAMRSQTADDPTQRNNNRVEDLRPLKVSLDPNEDRQQKMLELQSGISASKFLANNRIDPADRFTGDEDKDEMDLDSTINRYNLVVNQPGVTNDLKKLELKHYFAGQAGKIVNLYVNIENPQEAINKTLKHLRKEFSRVHESATKMLDKVLKGKPIDKDDADGLTKLRIDLATHYQRACETNRAATFNTTETIEKIIQTRVDFLAYKWCTEKNKSHRNTSTPQFEVFLEFLYQQNQIRRDLSSILGPSTTKKKKDGYAINTTEAEEVTASVKQRDTHSSRGRGRGRGNSHASSDPSAQINATLSHPDNVHNYRDFYTNNNRTANYNSTKNNTNPANNNNGSGDNNNSSTGNNTATNNYNNYSSQPSRGSTNNTRGQYQPRGQYRGQNYRGYNAGRNHNYGANRNNQHNNNNGSRQDTAATAQTGGAEYAQDKQQHHQQPAGENLWRCPCCNSTKLHTLVNCATFVNKSQEERQRDIFRMGRCLNCLGTGHRAMDCGEDRQCKFCDNNHHTLLHYAYVSGDDDKDANETHSDEA